MKKVLNIVSIILTFTLYALFIVCIFAPLEKLYQIENPSFVARTMLDMLNLGFNFNLLFFLLIFVGASFILNIKLENKYTLIAVALMIAIEIYFLLGFLNFCDNFFINGKLPSTLDLDYGYYLFIVLLVINGLLTVCGLVKTCLKDK